MAKKVTLYDNEENKLCQFYDCTIDICKSHTTIHKKNDGNIVVFPLAVERFEMCDNKTVVTYGSGHFIVIIR